jgi:hypothetical protein
MVDSVAVLYPRRKKMDGSSNALCLNCLATISMELENTNEAAGCAPQHICSPGLAVARELPLRSRGELH